MQYAAASPTPMSQFASLSLVLNNNGDRSSNSNGMTTATHHPLPFLVVAPTCTCTSHMAIAAVEEVRDHIQSLVHSTINKTENSNIEPQNDYTKQLLQEEAQSLLMANTIQIYRPMSTNGMAIHYRFLDSRSHHTNNTSNNGKPTPSNTNPQQQDVMMVTKLQSLILSSSSVNNKIDLSGKVLGVLLCVATTGGPSTIFSASSLSYTLCQRMNDCITHLQQQRPNTTISNAKELVTSYLLVDDELKIDHSVIQPAMDYIQLPHGKGGGRGGTGGNSSMMMTSPLGRIATPIAEFGFKAARRASTGIVRGVMNVGHNTNAAMTGNTQQTIPVETGFPLLVRPNSATASRSLIDQLTILSVTEHSTFLRKYEQSGQERKANFDLTGGTSKSRFRRRRTTDTTREADFDHFDYKGPSQQQSSGATATFLSNSDVGIAKGISTATTTASTISSTTMNSPSQNPPGKLLQFKSSAKDTKRGPGSRRPAATSTQQGAGSTHNDSMPSSQQPKLSKGGSNLSDRIDHVSNNSSNTKRMFNNNNSSKTDNDDMTYDSRSQQSSGNHPNPQLDNGSSSNAKSPTILGKLQINIALNEDLSCSYKLSQLASCSVDGIVQVQVKSSVPIAKSYGGIPFTLILKDPMVHIESLNENPKYATKTSSSNDASSFHNDCFNVIIPEQEKYFSLLKYRCKDDLRPVPIRVQAKVKTDGIYCRVALQISSNPNNESKLTDLTITMGVPVDIVYGESLVTQPAGGVYDTTKSSVIWCVSELGCGEKFQLQARFDMKQNSNRDANMNADDLNFPVLVRCQCLHVQLSGVGFEVRNINASPLPTDLVMKIASRFRLSHREKNS